MNFVHIVVILAIMQFFMFGILVGQARGKYGVKAPAISGNENFERAFRVQMNTLEQLVCFIPSLLIAAIYWSPTIMALIGLVYLAGRFVYWRSYTTDPSTRATGFLLTVVPTAVLIVASLAGAIFR